jgi:hypothetical protein
MNIPEKILKKEYEKGRRNPFTPAQWRILRLIALEQRRHVASRRIEIYHGMERIRCFDIRAIVHALKKKHALTEAEIRAARSELFNKEEKARRKKDGDKHLWDELRSHEEGRTR